jgi:hypothetical protein
MDQLRLQSVLGVKLSFQSAPEDFSWVSPALMRQ